jgi:hypothetical protein
MEDCALQVCVEPVDESGRGNRSCYNCCQLRLIKSSQACQIILPLRKEPTGPLCSTISNSKSVKSPVSQCIHKGHKGKKCRQPKLQITKPLARPEAEFWNIIGTKALRMFLLAIHSLSATVKVFYQPEPPPPEQKWFVTQSPMTSFLCLHFIFPLSDLDLWTYVYTIHIGLNILPWPADVCKEISLGFPSDEHLLRAHLEGEGACSSCQHLFQARKWAPKGFCWPAIRSCQVRRRRVDCSCLRCLQRGWKGNADTDDWTPMPMSPASKRMTSYAK